MEQLSDLFAKALAAGPIRKLEVPLMSKAQALAHLDRQKAQLEEIRKRIAALEARDRLAKAEPVSLSRA
jgi:hypothetical protein